MLKSLKGLYKERLAKFEEGKHPRGKDGKFTSGEGQAGQGKEQHLSANPSAQEVAGFMNNMYRDKGQAKPEAEFKISASDLNYLSRQVQSGENYEKIRFAFISDQEDELGRELTGSEKSEIDTKLKSTISELEGERD